MKKIKVEGFFKEDIRALYKYAHKDCSVFKGVLTCPESLNVKGLALDTAIAWTVLGELYYVKNIYFSKRLCIQLEHDIDLFLLAVGYHYNRYKRLIDILQGIKHKIFSVYDSYPSAVSTISIEYAPYIPMVTVIKA